jgi:hypothetical protein
LATTNKLREEKIRENSSNRLGDLLCPVRREDLLKPDSMSEVILLVAGVLVFVILLLILVVAVTQPSALF